jgi:hypothetical protein
MLQAVAAMIRGESAQDFMRNLANSDSRLKNLDLNNLNKTAEDLYNSQGKDINQAKQDILNNLNSISPNNNSSTNN